MQEFLPNSYPLGRHESVPGCPAGFVYRDSNGNSTREAGQVQLRRRLRSGFTATLDYTYAKSIDDDAYAGRARAYIERLAGGLRRRTYSRELERAQPPAAIAQNWRDLRGRARAFDLRSAAPAECSGRNTRPAGSGRRNAAERMDGAAAEGVDGADADHNAGTGLPETPMYPAGGSGHRLDGIIRARPDRVRRSTASHGATI